VPFLDWCLEDMHVLLPDPLRECKAGDSLFITLTAMDVPAALSVGYFFVALLKSLE
jgi:hypothetical protein